MPRPQKKRQICRNNLPASNSFVPAGCSNTETIILNIDEYETIRLLDGEGLTQQECAQRMGIARTSVQAIYESARKKLADFLIHGKHLYINGGSCLICDGFHHFCGNSSCACVQQQNNNNQ